MKKFLLSLATLLCAGTFASAEEVTINLNSSTGFTGDANSYTATKDGFTFTIDQADATSPLVAPDTEARIYKGATFTVTNNADALITKMVITSTETKYCGFSSADTGSGSWNETTYTWTGSVSSVVLTSGNAQTRAKSITITYTPVGGVTVAQPTFSLESGKYTEAQTVSISAADGCSIYYTTDGQTPTDDTADSSTNRYTEPITISTTTTLKAIAFDADDNKSAVATATYTIVELLEGAEGDGTEANPYNAAGAYNEAILGSTATVYVKGTIVSIASIDTGSYGNANYYISADGTETNQLYIYRGYSLGGVKFTAEDEIKAGDVVIIKGALATYNSVPQIAAGSEIVSLNGETPAPIELEGEGTEANPFTIADIIKINPTASDKNEEYPDKYWVKGYIVGRVDGQAYSPIFSATAVDETTAVSASNIVLGPTADTADKNLCIPVQLPTGDIRTALNLKDNPENLGKEVTVYGNIYKYFSVPAVKNTSDYKFAGSDSAIAVEIDANAPVEFFNLQGVRVDNPTNGLYIMRQGDKVVKVIK